MWCENSSNLSSELTGNHTLTIPHFYICFPPTGFSLLVKMLTVRQWSTMNLLIIRVHCGLIQQYHQCRRSKWFKLQGPFWPRCVDVVDGALWVKADQVIFSVFIASLKIQNRCSKSTAQLMSYFQKMLQFVFFKELCDLFYGYLTLSSHD